MLQQSTAAYVHFQLFTSPALCNKQGCMSNCKRIPNFLLCWTGIFDIVEWRRVWLFLPAIRGEIPHRVRQFIRSSLPVRTVRWGLKALREGNTLCRQCYDAARPKRHSTETISCPCCHQETTKKNLKRHQRGRICNEASEDTTEIEKANNSEDTSNAPKYDCQCGVVVKPAYPSIIKRHKMAKGINK